MNEVGDTAKAHWALRTLRERASVMMPAITETDRDLLRELIRKERRVELAFEDHRYLDVRRWKSYYDTAKHYDMTHMRQVKVTKTGDTSFEYSYDEYAKGVRVFTLNKHDFFPIPYDQTVKAPALGQNPNW
mgnify:CR=1 FL=1